MDIVLILLGILMLVCGGVLFIVTDGNVRDFDFWWNNGSDAYKNMVGMRNVAICIMVVGGILLLGGIIVLAVRKSQGSNKGHGNAAAGPVQGILRYCPLCGQPAGAGAFCQHCGGKLPEAVTAPETGKLPETLAVQGTIKLPENGAAVQAKKTGSMAPFILLLAALPAVDMLNVLISIGLALYQHMMYPEFSVLNVNIVNTLISAGKTAGGWLVGLIPIIVLTALHKIDPFRVRVRDVILWAIWCLSGLSIFHIFTNAIIARYGQYMLVGYSMSMSVEGKLSFSWLVPWLLLLLFLLVRSGSLRVTYIKFFVTAGVLVLWSIALVILIPVLCSSAASANTNPESMGSLWELLSVWIAGTWSYLPEVHAYAIEYLRMWACFVGVKYLAEIWVAALCAQEKIKWSGLAFVLVFPPLTYMLSLINLVVFDIGMRSLALATGAVSLLCCLVLTVLFIAGKSGGAKGSR